VHVATALMTVLGAVVYTLGSVGWLLRISEAVGPWCGVSKRHMRSLHCYWRRGWLAGCYANWRTFVADAVPPGATLIELAAQRTSWFAPFPWRWTLVRAPASPK
jgi:hypothetical protein